MRELLRLDEPLLRFGYGQQLANPKDGLMLFGPYTETPGSVRLGVIGTSVGIEKFNKWAEGIQRAIPAFRGSPFRTRKDAKYGKLAHQLFPGFQSAFRIRWNLKPEVVTEVSEQSLKDALAVHERNTRVSKVVKVYARRLAKINYESQLKPDLWFVIIPKEVFIYCRPESDAPRDFLEGTKEEHVSQFDLFIAKENSDSFAEEYREALEFKPDFHNQLKARLLKHQIITQILQEDTLDACFADPAKPSRGKQDPATIAWNLTSAIFFKTRRRPWILSDPRRGVCYMGLVFKRLNKNLEDGRNACCGAQMFLEDGQGMVFKGALGPWYSEESRECHLDEAEAERLLESAVGSYSDEHDGALPTEFFIHGSVRFDAKEWRGFERVALRHGIRLAGIRIRKAYESIKFYRRGVKPVMRGTAYVVSSNKAYLWSSGFTPRLNTYPGWEVPNPLDVEICNVTHARLDIVTVLEDILRLTKLNYNNCAFSDSLPITLKFAGKVGDILTTLPDDDGDDRDGVEPNFLPFWHYI